MESSRISGVPATHKQRETKREGLKQRLFKSHTLDITVQVDIQVCLDDRFFTAHFRCVPVTKFHGRPVSQQEGKFWNNSKHSVGSKVHQETDTRILCVHPTVTPRL